MRMNIYNLKTFLCVFVCIMTFHISAQENFKPFKDVETFRSRLQSESKNTSSITSQFIQERHLSAMTQPLVSRGHFWYKKPASVRWEYVEPYKSLIILTKRKVFIQEDQKKHEYDMQSGSAFQNLGHIMFSFILGDIESAEKDYHIEYLENKSLYFVKLTPRHVGQDIMSRIDLYFDRNDFSLSKIIMYEKGEDFTSIRFENKELNVEVPNEIFKQK